MENNDCNQPILEIIKKQIKNNPILLYMKGTPQFPQCGFSSQSVNIITKYIKDFAFINILEEPDIRVQLPKYANWPTFPQLWIKGDLVGGCDIILELEYNGDLKPIILSAISNKENIIK